MRRILLFEAQDGVRATLDRALRFRGLESVLVGTEAEMQQALVDSAFDLLIADIGTRPDDGCLSIVRWASRRYPQMLIILTAVGTTHDLVDWVAQQPRLRLLVKPFGMRQLVDMILDPLDRW